jgi:dienelactone hydrolase
MALGGSEGGLEWADRWGEPLASRGYALLALAYFGTGTLPGVLAEIPLEYFKTAIDWLQTQPAIDARRVAIIGNSKGAEAALLVAASHPEISLVVAGVPSHVIWQSPNPKAGEKSSWTLAGKPVPYVAYDMTAPFSNTLDLYTRSIQSRPVTAAAVIPVERVNGPVLLFSAKEDRVWPSTLMADRVIERLKERRFPFAYEHVSYDGAGHPVFGARIDPAGDVNARARADSFSRTIEFMNRWLMK